MEKQIYKFVCQDCLTVVSSDDWDKYHCQSNSCPLCKGDMCGCSSCVQDILNGE